MSTYPILKQLNLTLDDLPTLSGRERSRLLNYLLRWNFFDALHACLDILIPYHPTLVSLLDLRTRAFMAQNRPADALPVMEQRLNMRTSMTARALQARLYLAAGDAYAARSLAQKLVDENPDKNTAWTTLADIQVHMGDLDKALSTYRHIQARSPSSRAYLLGMMMLYAARADWITASGYATHLLRLAEEESLLPISTLHHLRDYFAASGETTRLTDIDAELEYRCGEELAEMRAYFAVEEAEESASASQRPRATSAQPPGEEIPAISTMATTRDQQSEISNQKSKIPVSDAERAHITAAIQRMFGFDTLLPGQVETIAAALRGEDVLTILPTGGGKSLCYQLPALLDETGTTLVVSPLIALMKDQVESLPAAVRAHATTINSSLNGGELRRRLAQVAAGKYRLVYAAPERLRQPPFLHTLRQAGINRLVIDEAHCVSVWGHDFRPDYLIIKRVREALGHPPLIAVTATAPTRVRRDIVQQLGQMHIVSGDSTRPNLRFEVLYAHNNDDKLAYLIRFCKHQSGSGIVYAGTRKRCERVAAMLRRYDIVAAHYHAGIANRAAVQDAFMTGHTRVIVATIAFGMGIDKADVRFIVHFFPPDSLESYYQEAGRAGRDGAPAHCLLMYTSADRGVLTRHARENVLPVEYLRAVYAAVKRHLNGKPVGILDAATIIPTLDNNEINFRVALSMLEEAELLYRGPDLPRSFILTRAATPPPNHPGHAFCNSITLEHKAHYASDYLIQNTALTLDTLETTLLAWAAEGWLNCAAGTRGMALRILPPPADAATRIPTLLERYETIQGQRVDEITAYVETGRCRHGHINAYLGGRSINHCTACDNCVATKPLPDPGLPAERAQLQAILRVLGNAYGWGRARLTAIMQGDSEVPDSAKRHKDFGALAFRSKSAIGSLIKNLERGSFIQQKHLNHGGIALEITPPGRQAMINGNLLDDLIQPQRRAKRTKRRRAARQRSSRTRTVTLTGEEITPPEIDEEFLNKLKTWRLALAQEKKVPAYVIFPNATLTAIATYPPTTLNALERIKGIGPRKLTQYGESVVQLVNEHLESKV